MRSQEHRNIQIARCLLPRRTNGQQLKHLPPHHTRLSPPVLTQEALRLPKSSSQLLGSFCLTGLRYVPKEDYDLEFCIGRAEVLKFVWSGVSSSDKSLGDYPLADWKTGGKGLVCDVDDRRRSVVDADPRGEPPKGLESPSITTSVLGLYAAEPPVNLLQELFMRDAILVPLRCCFSRE